MNKKKYLETLASFVTGEISLEALQEYVEETLADLRETRRPSDAKSRLSKLDLVLHEVREGAREPFDAYALALTMLQHTPQEPFPAESPLSQTSYNQSRFPESGRPAEPAEFDSEPGETAEHADLPLAESRA